MAKWSTVPGMGGNADFEVKSHTVEEDRNPNLYVERGADAFQRKQYAEAEKEYLKAVSYARKKLYYEQELLKFYYRTGMRSYQRKADRLFPVWIRGYDKFLTQITMVLPFLLLTIVGWMNYLLYIIPLLPFAMIYFQFTPKRRFLADATGKYGGMVGKSALLILFGTAFFFLYTVEEWYMLVDIESYGYRFVNQVVAISGASLTMIQVSKEIHYQKKCKLKYGE